jgi:Holliday junction resolvasome RuvABC endonuclease subunit
MSKRTVAISLNQSMVGIAGIDAQYGQFELPSASKSRLPGASSHPGAYLSELESYVGNVSKARGYDQIVVSQSEYGINAKSFCDAEIRARAAGVLFLLAAKQNLKVIEVAPRDVSEMAIGRKGATLEDYQSAAAKNGLTIKSKYAAEAYWMLVTATKG